MLRPSSTTLRRRRQALLRQLPSLHDVLRGSLIERYKRRGNPGCKCAEGRGHGPKYYLSVSFPKQRPQMDYVPQESCIQARTGLDHYQRACEINRELLRRRETL